MDRVLDRLNIIPDHHIQLGAILLELDLHAIDLSGLSRCEDRRVVKSCCCYCRVEAAPAVTKEISDYQF
ncbi:unnamed protein product [Sphagnum jensenii]